MEIPIAGVKIPLNVLNLDFYPPSAFQDMLASYPCFVSMFNEKMSFGIYTCKIIQFLNDVKPGKGDEIFSGYLLECGLSDFVELVDKFKVLE